MINKKGDLLYGSPFLLIMHFMPEFKTANGLVLRHNKRHLYRTNKAR